MITPHEYYLSVNGKTIDMDGAYGGQCWDLYAHYMKTLGYKYANCTTTGYVKDIWNNRKTNGMLDSCIEVSANELQDGDIAVWGNCDACPKSHIAIFRKDNGNGTGIFLGQNQSGKFVDQKSFTYTGILGCFRPKCYVVEEKPTEDKKDYQVGDTVTINGVYTSSTSTNKLTPAIKTGKITKIIAGARNPYLLNNGDIGWVNDDCIIGNTKPSTEIKVGDKVTPTSRYSYDGVLLISDVLKHKYTVTQIKGDRVVLGDGLNTAFKMSDLKK